MGRGAAIAIVTCLIGLCAPAGAGATPVLNWERCGKGVQCADAAVPRDYFDASKGTIDIALVKVPATNPEKRIGSLFFNFGGPGFGAVDSIKHRGAENYRALNRRYDLIGFDPRGTGLSRPAINCHADSEAVTEPIALPTSSRRYLVRGSKRLIHRCLRFDRGEDILDYVTTGNVARDLDQLRAAVGDSRLHYYGYSYGTVIGGTYQTLFPDKVGPMVLDGAVDLENYFNHPLRDWYDQVVSLQGSLDRFLAACKRDQEACSHFGGKDPRAALAKLHAQLDRHPLPAEGGRPVDGDDLLAALIWDAFSVRYWGELAAALRDAEQGDGSFLRALADGWFGRLPNGNTDPGVDANLVIATVDEAWPGQVGAYRSALRRTYGASKYLWWSGGSTSGIYGNVTNGLFPLEPNGVYRGPFENAASSPTTLVVATTHDGFTPYADGVAEAQQLGNSRLLTMRGTTHTAYPGDSPCIDRAVNAYLIRGVLPGEGKTCRQRVPFERLPASKVAAATAATGSGGCPAGPGTAAANRSLHLLSAC
jgi:pimeloyl-ACP methyl ester carboxylesterase